MEAEYCEDIQKTGYYKECLGKKNRMKDYSPINGVGYYKRVAHINIIQGDMYGVNTI